jgi:hypothetical protein
MVEVMRRPKYDWLAIIDPKSGWMLLATAAGVPVETTRTE